MNYAEMMAQDRRLVILRVLLESSAFGANIGLLRQFVESAGHAVSTDRLNADIAWLQEMDLIGVDGDVVRLTGRGGDVASGRAQVPGVRRLRPGE
ncbi:MAG: ArsR family transcriptional regulator [Burkholderia sp.]